VDRGIYNCTHQLSHSGDIPHRNPARCIGKGWKKCFQIRHNIDDDWGRHSSQADRLNAPCATTRVAIRSERVNVHFSWFCMFLQKCLYEHCCMLVVCVCYPFPQAYVEFEHKLVCCCFFKNLTLEIMGKRMIFSYKFVSVVFAYTGCSVAFKVIWREKSLLMPSLCSEKWLLKWVISGCKFHLFMLLCYC
jgi:hypothetical protein